MKLDDDPEKASQKYESLRAKLVRILCWRGCPESHADALADTALDRIAEKMAAGVEVENVGSYAAGVLRFVWLEYSRKHKEDAYGDDLPETAVGPGQAFDDQDERLECLRKCIGEIAKSDEDKRLIVGYYDAGQGDKNKTARRKLAEELKMSPTALRVRACRLRERLEACIRKCVDRVTKPPSTDTTSRKEVQK